MKSPIKVLTTKGKHEIITCPICKKRVAGLIPKGGDGSALKPTRHISALDGYTNPCPGIYEFTTGDE